MGFLVTYLRSVQVDKNTEVILHSLGATLLIDFSEIVLYYSDKSEATVSKADFPPTSVKSAQRSMEYCAAVSVSPDPCCVDVNSARHEMALPILSNACSASEVDSHTHTHTYTHARARARTRTHALTHTHAHKCRHTRRYVYVVTLNTHKHLHTLACTRTRTYVNTYIHECIHT